MKKSKQRPPYLKYLFYTYVILLAAYVTYKSILLGRYGALEIDFQLADKKCYVGGEGWRYCVYTNDNTNQNTYLYVLHGKDQDENFWHNKTIYSSLLQKYWQDQNSKIPKVITISLGPIWLITPQLSHKNTGLLEKFNNEIFNKIEGHIGLPRQRFLLGESMGGLNALSLYLHNPRFFSRVASLCPPIYSITPFSPPLEILSFIVHSGARPKSILTVLGIGRYLFKDDQEWSEFSPYHLIHRVDLKSSAPLYLTTGLHDEFGNFEATQGFAKFAKEQGAKVYWRANSGNHCSIDAPSLGQFLSF
jgi:pimeloyl-ACP methyl ester carboxylesterase